jgi:diacylglycerol kinase (ATP)
MASTAWMKVRAHLDGSVKTLRTNARGHATQLTKEAIEEGANTIVAVGGDGTINEVVNGFFERDRLISANVKLAILPHGTGSDFSRMLHLPDSDQKAAALIQRGEPRPLDLMKVRYTTMEGVRVERYSVNITGFGMSGAVASRVNRSSKAFGGKASYVLATVSTAMTFRGNDVTISLDNSTPIEAKITNVAVGNGQYHGAGMLVCPRASIDDGLLDITLIEFFALPELIRNLPLLYNGKIYGHPKIRSFRAKCVRADAQEPTLCEIDGEPVGRLPIEIAVVPEAIRILTL